MSGPAVEERHATWLELFFDLVIVAAVAQLARLLHDRPDGRAIFLFAVLYYAMWSVWTAFTLYANVAGTRTRQRAMLAAMFGIAIMAASVPQLVAGNPRVFILAYAACRVLGSGSWKRSSRVMTELPGVQQALGVIPWFASLGFEPPVRYWLWVAGVAVDVVISLSGSRAPERLVEAERRDRERERRRWRRFARRRSTEPPDPAEIQAAQADRPHLGERLGLFVIIVLGEAVAQLVSVAANVPRWHLALWLVVLAGFGLLVSLWWLTLQYGSGAAPVYGVQVFSLRLTMPTHFLTTGSIVVVAAGLGSLADHAEGSVPAASRWVLCAGTALYFLTAAATGLRGGAARRWVIGWAVPAVLASVLLGLFAGRLLAWALVGSLLLIMLWQVAYRGFDTDRADSAEPAAEPRKT